MKLLHILLMAPPQGSEGNPWMSFLPILLIIVVFYFFMIRPQLRKAKAEREFKESTKKGDRIITIGGIHGKIVEVQDTTFTIETEGSNLRLKIEKSAVSADATKALNKQK